MTPDFASAPNRLTPLRFFGNRRHGSLQALSARLRRCRRFHCQRRRSRSDQARGRAAAQCRPWRCRQQSAAHPRKPAQGQSPRDRQEADRDLSQRRIYRRGDARPAGLHQHSPEASGLLCRAEDILVAGPDYGVSASGAGKKINVEFVSANPTGPLHVGHCRGAIFGDALANLLKASGATVTREYYINDAGAQIEILARSVYLRYREALGEDIGEIPPGLYPGDYLKPVGEALRDEHGRKLLKLTDKEWLPIVSNKSIAMMMDMIRADLAALDIRHEVFSSERALLESGAIPETIAAMRKQGLVFQGRLPPPKGQLPEDWEDREQTLFRATAFGDDIDRPLQKSDGSYTYFAGDVAYARDKIRAASMSSFMFWVPITAAM